MKAQFHISVSIYQFPHRPDNYTNIQDEIAESYVKEIKFSYDPQKMNELNNVTYDI